MKARKCCICGADISREENDWGLILSRKEHFVEPYGTMEAEVVRKRVVASWPMCEICSWMCVGAIRRAVEEKKR